MILSSPRQCSPIGLHAHGRCEGNKRTALLLARWVLDRNRFEGVDLLPPDDRLVADLLVEAAAGTNVEEELVALLNQRR